MDEFKVELKKKIIDGLQPGEDNVKKMYTTHYYFLQNKKLMDTLDNLIKYIIATEDTYTNLADSSIRIKNIDDILLFMNHNDAINKYYEILVSILNIENYKLLLTLDKIPIQLYTCTIGYDEDYEKNLEIIVTDVRIFETFVKRIAAIAFKNNPI